MSVAMCVCLNLADGAVTGFHTNSDGLCNGDPVVYAVPLDDKEKLWGRWLFLIGK